MLKKNIESILPYIGSLILFLLLSTGNHLFAQSPNYSRPSNNLKKHATHIFHSVNPVITHINISAQKFLDRKSNQPLSKIINDIITAPEARSTSQEKKFTIAGAIVLNISSTGSTCGYSNGTITISASNGTAPYQFSLNGSPLQTAGAFTALAAGTYNILVQDATTQTATTTVTLTNTYVPPTASVLGYVNATCGASDASVTVAGSGGTPPYTYSIDMVNFQASNVFTNLAPGDYSFFVRDANGCVAPIYFPLSQPCPLSFGYTYSLYVCTNEGMIEFIHPTGGTPPYVYSMDGINFQSNPQFTNLSPGLYHGYIKDAAGLILIEAFPIYHYCLITISATTTDASCGTNDGTITVAASNGAGPYLYSLDGVNFQVSNIFTGLAANNYTVTVKDFNGATSSLNPVVITSECPSITATATDETCTKQNGTITANGSNGTPPYQYSIDAINFQSSNIFSNLSAGNYTVTLKDANGNTTTTNIVINNSPGPGVFASATNNFCDPVNLGGTINASATGGTAPVEFSIGGAFQATGVFSNLNPGLYNVTARDANGCSSSVPVTIPLVNSIAAEAGNDKSICEGTSTQLQGFTNGSTFSWTPSAGLSDPNIINPVASPGTTTKYYLKANSGLCDAIDSVTITVDPAPIANAGTEGTICYGKDFQLKGSGGTSFLWEPSTYLDNPNISNPTAIKPANSITYSLTVKDANGCASLQAASITVTITPDAKIFAGNDTSIGMNQSLQLNAVDLNNSGFTQYSWSPVFGLNNPFIQNPIASLTDNATYTVTAIAPGGCQATDQINIKVFAHSDIYVPNAFTPNGDGRNDLLKALAIGIKEFKYFRVYNRWGQLVFNTADPGKGWNGTINGITQDTGTYVWSAEGISFDGNIIQKKGTATLLR